MDQLDLSRWTVFMKWAHARGYMVNLYRPKNDKSMYYDYRIQLRMKDLNKTLVSRSPTLELAIDSIKTQLLELNPGKQG